MTDPSRVIELKEGGEPVVLTLFNRVVGHIVPSGRYQELLELERRTSTRRAEVPVAEPSDGQLVRLDAQAYRSVKQEAESRKVSLGVVASDWIRKAVQ